MKEIYLGRQPIYDSAFHVQGYELLYHSTNDDVPLLDIELARTQALFDTLTETGLERLVGDSTVLLGIARDLFVRGCLQQLITPSPQMVLEVVTDMAVDLPLLEALKALRQQGYRFLLNDYMDNEAHRVLLDVVEYVRVNLSTTAEPEARRIVAQLRPRGLALIAGGIEDQHTLELCQALRFDLFQGPHFSLPRLFKFKAIATNQLPVLRLISALHQPDTDIKQVESLIAQDVVLSYKLLRYINSAYFSLPQRVDSIQRAVSLLGLRKMTSWATLLSLSSVETPRDDLMTIALVRAKMCELLGEQLGLKQRDSGFTVGLLSVLDLVTQAPMPEVLAALPLEEDIDAALLNHEGMLGQILACTLAYERCDWAMLKKSGLDTARVNEAYLIALADAYQISHELLRD